MLRALVEQRLTAATEEISGLFERRMEENSGELLDSVYNTQLRLHRADVQQLLVVKEEVPTEQQEWSSSLDQEDPEPPHIKEEPEDLWTSQEGEQLQRLEEADITFPFTTVHVKSEEDDEDKAQSSRLYERQTEENREAEHLKTEADEEDSDPDSHLQPATHDETSPSSESETDDSRDWEETKEPQSGSDPLQNNEISVFNHITALRLLLLRSSMTSA
ncbi:glutamic acid-rich protein-like isoform X8 [Sebastes umbrosus]|uniref:glutamic acid-rich protein-like isoform X8 n=1 Tax=Sebastes umbrosus TaxID=72105 RepID=UPI00189CA093|nr:glutamic acid-rich protein-like isoform X8 [Sebastes umbrosus]